MIEDSLRRELPGEKRILTDEIYKILYFNNADPELYTVSFWANHFKISPAVIRNIVNYVAFPIINVETKQVDRVLTFIDSELQQSAQHLIGELNRDTYFRYLEADYSQRMVEQHKDEQGIFGKIEPTLELADDPLSQSLDNYLIQSKAEDETKLIEGNR